MYAEKSRLSDYLNRGLRRAFRAELRGGLMMGKKRCPYNVPWTYNTGQEAQEMKDLQKELEEARADVTRWMEKVRTASNAREMMEHARELTEAQLHLEALEWIWEEDDDDDGKEEV